MGSDIEKIIAKVKPRYYFLLSLASLGIAFSPMLSQVKKPYLSGLLLEHQSIESKLDNLDILYNQFVKVKNMVDINYFKNLENLKNSLLSQKRFIESSYGYTLLKIEYDLQVKEYKNYDNGFQRTLIIFLFSSGFLAFLGISSWQDRYHALESEKLKEKKIHSNK